MKNNLVLGLALLLSTGTMFCPDNSVGKTTGSQVDNPYIDKKPIVLIKDFLDLNKKPDKPFKWWVACILQMVEGNKEHYKDFLKEFAPAVRARNANRIGLSFFKYKERFDADVVAYIQKLGVSNATKILETRLKKK